MSRDRWSVARIAPGRFNLIALLAAPASAQDVGALRFRMVFSGVARLAIVGVLCAACAMFGASDPRAAGSRDDRWEVVIARPRWVVFDAARRVLADSGYVLGQANLDVGAMSTADRKAGPVAPGTLQPATGPSRDYPVRLSLMMTPLGADSTRLSITGQYRSGNAGTVNARSAEWHLVKGIGEAILLKLR